MSEADRDTDDDDEDELVELSLLDAIWPGDDDKGSRPDCRVDASCLTVGANCRGIVKSSGDRGAIRLGIRRR